MTRKTTWRDWPVRGQHHYVLVSNRNESKFRTGDRHGYGCCSGISIGTIDMAASLVSNLDANGSRKKRVRCRFTTESRLRPTAMTTPDRIAGHMGLIRLAARYVAIAIVWLVVVAIATGCFFPPWSSFPPWISNDWDSFHNALAFGSAAAIAGAVATALGLAIGGKTKWAREFVFAATFAVALLAAGAYACFWLNPWLARSWMGHWELLRLRDTMTSWSVATVRYELPLGAVVGLLAGAIAGLVVALARRRPRIAMGLVVGMLFAAAIEPVQRLAFGLVLAWGQIVRSIIWSPGMTDPYVPAFGATVGAIAGGIVAAVAMRPQRTLPKP
jgi:MFS family permease